MTTRSRLIAILALLPVLGLLLMAYSARHDLMVWLERMQSEEDKWFARVDFPYTHMTYLYDMGVVDANGDGHLDIYTSNHNYRQSLLLADGRGGYREALGEWGLDQDPSLPSTEQHRNPPTIDRPGLYIYWQGDVLHIVRHRTRGWAPLRGHLRFNNRIELLTNEGFRTRVLEQPVANAAVPVVRLDFAAETDGVLRIYPRTRGTPIQVELDAPWLAQNVFLGAEKVSPQSQRIQLQPAETRDGAVSFCRWCQRFELTVRDRHAMLWADYNGDGWMDIFINRGALGGMLRRFPPETRTRIKDEFLISTGSGRFVDRARELGLKKNDCSGRHARWVDFDRDGRLDLYINCQDRGKAGGEFPKQLYRQLADGHLQEVAAEVGLDLPDRQIVDMVWFDADGDGRIDLFTHEGTGFYLYRNQTGRFVRESLGRGPFHRGDVNGLSGETTDYWQFDGKLSVTDYDGDGDLDVFMTSKRGNAFLINDYGRFRLIESAMLGLPRKAVACQWVDYDNDARPDLHCVPQGIYRQQADGRFVVTNMLRQLDNKYQAAIIQWYDRDDDGRLDLLLALQDNASLWRWWEKLYKRGDVKGRDDRFDWKVQAWRNIGGVGHWLQIDLQGPRGNPQAIGASLQVVQGDAKTPLLQVGAHERAYSSQGHYRLYLGLGENQPRALAVLWPTGESHLVPLDNLDRKIVLAYSAMQPKTHDSAKPRSSSHRSTDLP